MSNMDELFKSRLYVNGSNYRSSMERIIEKYSKLQYQGGGLEVDLDRTEPRVLERYMRLSRAEISKLESKSLTDLREESIRAAPDFTRDSELDFTYEDGGADESRASTTQMSAQDHGMSTNDSTGLTEGSPDESSRDISATEDQTEDLMEDQTEDQTEVQPEDGDEELELSLSSHGSSLLELYPDTIDRIGRAWRRQHVSEAAGSVLRRYRRWRRRAGRGGLGNTLVVTGVRAGGGYPEHDTSLMLLEEQQEEEETRNSPKKRRLIGDVQQQSPLRVNHVQQQSPLRVNHVQQQSPLRVNHVQQQSPLRRVNHVQQQSPLRVNHVQQQSPLRRVNHVQQQSPLRRVNHVQQQSPLRVNHVQQQSPLRRVNHVQQQSPLRVNHVQQQSPLRRVNHVQQQSPLRVNHVQQQSPLRVTHVQQQSPLRRVKNVQQQSPLKGVIHVQQQSPLRRVNHVQQQSPLRVNHVQQQSPLRRVNHVQQQYPQRAYDVQQQSPVKRVTHVQQQSPQRAYDVQQQSPWRLRGQQQPVLVMDVSGPPETFVPSELNETFTVSEDFGLGGGARRLSLQADLHPAYAAVTGGERRDVCGSSPSRRSRVATSLGGSPRGLTRSPRSRPGESFPREPSGPTLSSTPPPLHPRDAHSSLRGGRHGLRRHLSFDSSLPALRVADSPRKLDEAFLKLYHKFVCQNKSSFFNRHPCRLCARSGEAGGGPSSSSPSSSSSSSSLAALALSPHRSLLRKRHRELDRDGPPRSKRYREERCPSSPGSQRHGKEMLRRGLSFGAGTPGRRRAADFSGTGSSLESRRFSPRKW